MAATRAEGAVAAGNEFGLMGGIALAIVGAWAITQVLFGHALERLGVISG